MDYKRGMSPRTRLCGKIFSSTDTRPDFPIPLHTEMAYSPNYPQGVVFSCATPAEEGGETPLIDLRKVIAGIPDHAIAELERRGLLYSQIAPLVPTPILTLTWLLSGMEEIDKSPGLDASKALDCTYGDGGALPADVLEDVRRCTWRRNAWPGLINTVLA